MGANGGNLSHLLCDKIMEISLHRHDKEKHKLTACGGPSVTAIAADLVHPWSQNVDMVLSKLQKQSCDI